MTKAVSKHITPPPPAMVAPNFKRALPLPAQPALTPLDALRVIAEDGDYLGIDPDGCHWFLFPAPQQLAEYLEAFDSDEREGSNAGHGGTDDDEDTHDREHDYGDLEDDRCGDQPAFETPFYPSAKDKRDLVKAEKWLKRVWRRRRTAQHGEAHGPL